MSSNESTSDRPRVAPETVVPDQGVTAGASRPRRRIAWMRLAIGSLAIIAALVIWQRSIVPVAAVPAIEFAGVHPAVRRVIELAQKAVQAEPRSGLAWGRLGMVFSAHEYSTESIACFREAARLDKGDVRWPYLLGVALENGDPASSLAAYHEAISRDRDLVLPKLRLAELSLTVGNLDVAEDLLNQLIARVPSDARVQYRMAQLLFRRGRLEEAMSCALAAQASAPQHRMIAELLTRLRHSPGLKVVALRGTEATVSAEPTETGWPDPMLEEVRQFRRDAYWRADQAQQMIAAGDVVTGLAELETAVSDAPDDWTLRTQLGRAYISANRRDEAERLLSDSIERFPAAFDLFRLRGSTRLLSQRWGAAIDDFRRALALKPDDAASHADLGFCLRQSGDHEGARTEFQEALRLDPTLEGARIQYAKLLIELNESGPARAQLEILLQRTPSHAEARSMLKELTSDP